MKLASLFEVASEDRTSRMAREISTLLLKSLDVSRSLDAALRLLYDCGSRDIANSRTIALVSESIYLELLDRNEYLAGEFKYSLGRLAASVFLNLWHIDTLPPSNQDSETEPEFQPTHDQLACVSSFIADLYAMSLIPQDWLCEFASFITERFTHRDQLSNLEILLSRANSYMGKKLPVSVYLKLASNVRTRCLQVLRHNEMTHQESELRCLLRALIRDSWHENNFISRYSSIPYQHVVNDDYNCDMMMLDNIDDLEALYRLEARDELELNATAVSDTESVSSLSVSTESESPEGLRPFIDLEDSETLLSDADSDEGTDKSKSASGV